MSKLLKYGIASAALLTLSLALASPVSAQKKYDPGATDTEIKIGQTAPYSGPISAVSTIAKAEIAYFKMLDEQGGINGRKVTLLSLDDAYQPAKAVEQTRKLVEEDKVLAIAAIGTVPSAAVQAYLNQRKVPQLFVISGAARFADPTHFPWTIGWAPGYFTEGRIYAKHILQSVSDPKIAVLYENDDFGKEYLNGFRSQLGDKADTLIVKQASYEVSDPTVDTQIIALQASGANALFSATAARFGAQSIRKVADIGWKPLHVISSVSTAIAGTLVPAGLDKAVGLISTRYVKDPSDPAWANDKGVQDYLAYAKKYLPESDPLDPFVVTGYSRGQTLAQALKQCGDDLTRANLMKQSESLHDFELPMLVPGIKLNTSETRYTPIEQMQLMKFDGKSWVGMGGVLSGS